MERINPTERRHRFARLPFVAAVLASLGAAMLQAAEAPQVRVLRTQRVGDTIYFQVQFEPPGNLENLEPVRFVGGEPVVSPEPQGVDFRRVPRLVPQDNKSHAVYYRYEIPRIPPDAALAPALAPKDGKAAAPPAPAPAPKDAKPAPPPAPAPAPKDAPVRQPAPPDGAPVPLPVPPPVEGLEFVGKATQEGPIKFLLLYPMQEAKPAAEPGKKEPERQNQAAAAARRRAWVEVPVVLNLATAKKVAVPPAAKDRKPAQPISPDDLERLWAIGQAEQFAMLEALASDFSFYGFAREATGRKYAVPAPSLTGGQTGAVSPELLDRQLYETTTGAAAITESLQQHRLLNPGARDTGERKIDIAKVAGIDIAEHPWEKMMGKKKPAIELLARFVPNDNYYLHFKSFSKLLALGDLLDEWGTDLIRAYELHSRDFRLRDRYEKQLCIRSTQFGRLFGPAVIQSLALTGSDPYLREGSDIAILFQARNKEALLAALDRFVQEARKEFGQQLREDRETYQGVAVESFVTPLREVSLHRAALGDVVVYCNSPVGLRRILDAHQGRRKALADSLDFQYMRTVYRLDDPHEDAFLFLSDPFIRQLVGPAGKIKEKRRLEALTSLAMVTNGVLFTAWETAQLPADRKTLLTASGLKSEELYAPGARDVAWDARRRVALSDLYNTLTFATPLIELPIDRVTEREQQSYERFRQEYLGLWRQYFDPIGMRIGLKDQQVRVETYILPLIQNSSYGQLRQVVGGGTTVLDPASISPKTLLQLTTHLNRKGEGRADLTSVLSILDGRVSFDFLGDWFLLRLDDSPVYAKIAALLEDLEGSAPGPETDPRENAGLFFEIPLTVGVEIRNPMMLAGLLAVVRAAVLEALPGVITWGAQEPAYKGVSIVCIRADAEKVMALTGGKAGRKPTKRSLRPFIYYALIGDGFYISLAEEPLKDLIDSHTARRDGKVPPQKGEPVAINSSFYAAPGAAVQAGEAIRMVLARQVGEHALASAPVLYALYRAGLVDPGTPQGEVQAAAMRYLGFVPVSPDGTPFVYDPKTDEVRNVRYGSVRQPQPHRLLDKDSPLGRLLDQIQSLRADLRFHEDGIQTVLILDRKGPAK
jgi:hypothetical protein